MILANFFILNLFVGIILDNFAQITEEAATAGAPTKEQQLWAQRKRMSSTSTRTTQGGRR